MISQSCFQDKSDRLQLPECSGVEGVLAKAFKPINKKSGKLSEKGI